MIIYIKYIILINKNIHIPTLEEIAAFDEEGKEAVVALFAQVEFQLNTVASMSKQINV